MPKLEKTEIENILEDLKNKIFKSKNLKAEIDTILNSAKNEVEEEIKNLDEAAREREEELLQREKTLIKVIESILYLAPDIEIRGKIEQLLILLNEDDSDDMRPEDFLIRIS